MRQLGEAADLSATPDTPKARATKPERRSRRVRNCVKELIGLMLLVCLTSGRSSPATFGVTVCPPNAGGNRGGERRRFHDTRCDPRQNDQEIASSPACAQPAAQRNRHTRSFTPHGELGSRAGGDGSRGSRFRGRLRRQGCLQSRPAASRTANRVASSCAARGAAARWRPGVRSAPRSASCRPRSREGDARCTNR